MLLACQDGNDDLPFLFRKASSSPGLEVYSLTYEGLPLQDAAESGEMTLGPALEAYNEMISTSRKSLVYRAYETAKAFERKEVMKSLPIDFRGYTTLCDCRSSSGV